tara:strand:- start:1285 stop:1401 length:117 start_codon:yes stop_codon:yes gene_type:complete
MKWEERIEVIERIKSRLLKNSPVNTEQWAYELARKWAQ